MAISGFSLELTQSMANLYGNSCTPRDFVFSAADSRACSCCKAETAFGGEGEHLKFRPRTTSWQAQVQLWVSAFNGFNVARLLSSAPPTNSADTYPISCASRRPSANPMTEKREKTIVETCREESYSNAEMPGAHWDPWTSEIDA